MKLTIFTDGASRGNPGHSSYGFVILSDGKVIHQEGKYIGKTTNNVAEYSAVLRALEYLSKKMKGKLALEVNLFADSQLVARQLSGHYKVKAQHLKPLIDQIKTLELEIGSVSYHHIPRGQNSLADKLANQALDSR